jgi:hypothetical protein
VEAASAATAAAPSSTAAQGDADDAAAEVDAEELRESLAEGELHCLFWLYGLELPGRDDAADWGDGFQVRSCASLCLPLVSRSTVDMRFGRQEHLPASPPGRPFGLQ